MTFTAAPISPDKSVIHRLPDHLINQIAAGEVIERPASVLKELIENSLDAGATRIEVLLSGGGIKEIQVWDNGLGISRVDLLKTVERHATSKISRESDLEAISTFGFRGEALSSIASVAHLSINSRKATSASGFGIHFLKGIPQGEVEELSAPIGTQVIVKDLFKWVPARFKFLRSASTELSYCQRIVRELALGNPHVRFYLKHDGRSLGSWITSHRKDRFLECLKVSWKPLEVRNKRDDIEIEGYFSPTHVTVARAELFLFINGRPVRNRPFLSAIRSVFTEHLGPHYEPVGVCYLDIRKDWVDVNVHPQKWEVRCLQQESIYQWLITTLREQLGLKNSSASFVSSHLGSDSSHSQTLHPSLRFVAQTSNVLICEDASGIIVADIQKLCEGRTKRQIMEEHQKLDGNKKFLPASKMIHFSQGQVSLILENQDKLKSLGFDFESFGESDYALRAHPQFISEEEAVSVFQAIVSHLSEPGFLDSDEKLLSVLVSKTEVPSLSNYLLLEELEWQCRNTPAAHLSGVVRLSFSELREGMRKS